MEEIFQKIVKEVSFWVALVPAVLVFLGVAVKEFREHFFSKKVTALKAMESSVDKLSARVDVLEDRNDTLEETNDVLLSRVYSGEEYISMLRLHIIDRKPPPPPDRSDVV